MDGAETPQGVRKTALNSQTLGRQASFQKSRTHIRYCLPSPIVGYNVEDHIETAKWYANQRASSIGLPPVYEGAQHRFPWMSEQVSIRKEKNFFETRPTEYRTGGALSWDD